MPYKFDRDKFGDGRGVHSTSWTFSTSLKLNTKIKKKLKNQVLLIFSFFF